MAKQTAATREAQQLARAIKAVSYRTKKYVEKMSKGKTEVHVDNKMMVKLQRWENNYYHTAMSLANGLEQAKVKPSPPPPPPPPPGRSTAEMIILQGAYDVGGPKQPMATLMDIGLPTRCRTASQACDMAYGIAQPPAPQAIMQEPGRTSSGEVALRAPFLHTEQRHQISTPLSPGMKQAEAAATSTRPRIQMPAFVINPHKNAKEPGGPDLHYKERDFGASARELFNRPRVRGERTIEPQILRRHQWSLSLVADLPSQLGGTNEEVRDEVEPSPEHGMEDDLELEDYISETPTPVKCEPLVAEPEPKKLAFNWKAFQVKEEALTPPAAVPTAFMAAGEHAHNRHKVEEEIAKRRDSAMEAKETPYSSLTPTGKTFSMNETLPEYGTNLRGRYFNPNDPHRDTLRMAGMTGLQDTRSSLKRGRSPTSGMWHPNGKAICLACRQTNDMCTSNGQCERCASCGQQCVYAHCSAGVDCSKRRCTFLHPGQFDESHGGDWSVVGETFG